MRNHTSIASHSPISYDFRIDLLFCDKFYRVATIFHNNKHYLEYKHCQVNNQQFTHSILL